MSYEKNKDMLSVSIFLEETKNITPKKVKVLEPIFYKKMIDGSVRWYSLNEALNLVNKTK
ncbi:hypothetical protein [Tenacibaculum caenipelagi]|nr:hypothetical protein [Tenacibaculum caenipelagi]